MNCYALTLCAFIATHFSLHATLSDDITAQETAYAARLLETTNLQELQGTNRSTHISSLQTAITSLKNAIDAVITDNGGLNAINAISTAYGTRLTNVQTNANNLSELVADFTPIATMQQATLDTLYTLATLRPSPEINQTNDALEIANITAINRATTTIAAAYTTAVAINTAGVGNDGGLTTTDSLTEFNIELLRLLLTKQLVELMVSVPGITAALRIALSAIPDPQDDTFAYFDAELLRTQSAITSIGSTLINVLTPALTKVQSIIDTETDTLTSIIPSVADTVKNVLTLFAQEADKQIKNAALTTTEINMRTLQRQYLFDSISSAAKKTMRTSIQSIYQTQLIDTQALINSFAQLAQYANETTIAFPETPLPTTAGGKSGIEQLVDLQFNADLAKKRADLELLTSNNPPPTTLISNALSRITPALRVNAAAKLMFAFADKNTENNASFRFAAASNITTITTTLSAEWNEYLRLFNLYITDPEVNKSRTENGDIINYYTDRFLPQITSNITDLFVGITTASSPAVLLNRRLSALTNRRNYLAKIQNHSNNFQTLILNELISEYDHTRTIQPAATPTSIANSATNTIPATQNADFDNENIIDGAIHTRSDLANGTSLLIAGENAQFDDPIISSAVDKLQANIKIYLKDSAKIGLGAANISIKSGGQSPNTLGGSGDETNSIQLIADGNGFVQLYSDIYITGSKPFIPTKRFGQGAEHRLTFYSDKEVAIRVKRNVTLDLTAFGNSLNGSELGTDPDDTTTYKAYGKQIVFAGKTSLVLEPGAKIRLPKVPSDQGAMSVVLYFNDDSKLLCEADLTNENRRFEESTLTGTDCIRNKILGMGQIWLNKNATMSIPENAYFGIESDYTTPLTDVTFSLQRNAKFFIGDTSTKGGAFQIGNIFEGGSKRLPHGGDDATFPNTSLNSDLSFVPRKNFINFSLILNGPETKCVIGRNGFFGCAAGILNKNGRMNGTADLSYADCWQVHRLYNVGNITLDITQGIFEHTQIADGNDASQNGSLFACGQLLHYPSGKYLLKMGSSNNAFLRGGGNLLFVDKDASLAIDEDGALVAYPLNVSIGSTAAPLTVDSLGTTNTGKYGICAPSKIIRTRWEQLDSTTSYSMFGRAFVIPSSSSYIFAGPAEEFFQLLTLPDILSTSDKFVVIGYGGSVGTYAYAYLDGTSIVRASSATITSRDIDPTTLNPSDVLTQAMGPGYLYVRTLSGSKPLTFRQPNGG